MKRIWIVLLLAVTALHLQASDDKNIVSSVLKAATVYRSGAELQHSARAQLSQGNNELVIDGISNRIDLNSLQIKTSESLSVLSMEFSTDYLRTAAKSALINKLEDSLEILNKDLKKIQVLIKTNNEMLDLLKANKEIGGTQTGLSVAELTKMMDYYKSKTLEIQNENNQYQEKETKLLLTISKIGKQIKEEEQKNSSTTGKLLLQLYCPVSGSYNFDISYITPTASWKPAYDLKAESVTKPIQLAYKAKVVQTTGIDWKQVKLALSTSVPAQHNSAPVFKSWFLAYTNSVYIVGQGLEKKNAITGAAPVDDKSLEEVVVRGYSTINSENSIKEEYKEPLYIVNGVEVSRRDFNKIEKKAIKDLQVLKDAQATAIYGSRGAGGVYLVTLKDGLGDYVSIDDHELNITFNIDLPYDVPSNGKEQNVILKEIAVPATYKYYSAPKLDNAAYLLGEIAGWESLNLLPGEASIMFEGTYIGKTFIDPASTLDTLNLTMGNDKRVVVTREKMVDYSSVKFLGSNKKQVFTYELTVKNNKKEKIQMTLKDQYPLSSNKDIEVELLESSGASVNAEIGVLTWQMELKPGETKKLRLSYSVKYPKDRVVNAF